MAGQDPSVQNPSFHDPYFRVTPLADTQFVQTARPVVLTQDSNDIGVLGAAADKDIVVYADVVTVQGKISVHREAATTTSGGTDPGEGGGTAPSGGTAPAPAPSGGRVVIVARQLCTLPGKTSGGQAVDAKLDLTGEAGKESSTYLAVPPAPGKKGDPGVEGGIFTASKPGGPGQSSADASGKVDPHSPLNGKDGDPGGPGGKGGSLELRCGSLDSTDPGVALAVDVSGGKGGDGRDGQPGALGGPGGDGVGWQSISDYPSGGGNGGRGGDGGAGGAPGPGGDPGSVSIWLLNGSASGITCTLSAGAPGNPGTGGKHGDGGAKGHGGFTPGRVPVVKPDGQTGADGDDGATPQKLKQGDSAKPAITTPCDGSDLVHKLTLPLAPQLAMMLDLLRADYLQTTAALSAKPLDDMRNRLNWVSMLATNYVPLDLASADASALDAVRARIQTMHERLRRGFDYFGNGAAYAPLGELSLYQQEFDQAIDTLSTVYDSWTDNLGKLDTGNATTQEIQKADETLTADQSAYANGVDTERKAIKDLISRINGHDSDAVATAQVLVAKATAEFEAAIDGTLDGLTVTDLIAALGQLAFLGEGQFQQAAMITSQTANLIQTATSKCLEQDGTQVDKKWVIDQLDAVSDLQKSLAGFKGVSPDGKTIKLADPVKLLAEQADLDQLCLKFWNTKGAEETKVAFDDFVSAVQARNADIVTLNESLARLRGYLAGEAQARASLDEAKDAKSTLSAPGAPALVTQLSRMVTRATDDCIYYLYQMSRAYWMWSLQPGDELARQLTAIAGGDPLAITPDVLKTAALGLANDYTDVVTAQLQNAGEWFPKPANDAVWYPPPDARGIRVPFTAKTHPRFINDLRTKRSASIGISAPRWHTPATGSPFSGYADVRITKVRLWIFGARLKSTKPAKPVIRVDLTHTGRETIMSPDDTVTVVTHDPVGIMFEYLPDQPDSPAGIQTDGELFKTDTPSKTPPPGSMIGPFTRWQVQIPDIFNDPSLDTSRIDQVVFEFFGHQRPYPPL